MVSVLRPGDRILNIPGIGVSVLSRRAVASAAAAWWPVAGKTCTGAYAPKGAASYAASKINLENPGPYDFANGAAYPTWDAAIGWTLNGVDQFLTSALPSGTRPMTVILRTTIADSGAKGLYMLASSGSGSYRLGPATVNGRIYLSLLNVVDIASSSPVVTQNVNIVYAISYAANGAYAFYANGTPAGSGTNNQSPTARTTIIGKYFGSPDIFAVGTVQAFAQYADVLTAGEVAEKSAAMAAL